VAVFAIDRAESVVGSPEPIAPAAAGSPFASADRQRPLAQCLAGLGEVSAESLLASAHRVVLVAGCSALVAEAAAASLSASH
jgi:hypothetical protein